MFFKKRKVRTDKKRDIKFRLSLEDKKELKRDALEKKLSLTAFTSQIVRERLLEHLDYTFYEYAEDGDFVHVVLLEEDFKKIEDLSIEWNQSYRKVAHCIVKSYISSTDEEEIGFKIHAYFQGN